MPYGETLNSLLIRPTQAQLTQVQNNYNYYYQQANNANNTIATLQNNERNLREELSRWESRFFNKPPETVFQELENEREEKNQVIAGLNSQISSLNSQLSNVRYEANKVLGLQSTVYSLQNELSNLQQEHNQYEEREINIIKYLKVSLYYSNPSTRCSEEIMRLYTYNHLDGKFHHDGDTGLWGPGCLRLKGEMECIKKNFKAKNWSLSDTTNTTKIIFSDQNFSQN